MKNCKNELSKRENWETGCSHGTQVRCQEEDQHIRQNHQRRQHIWWQCTSQQYIPEQRKLTAMNPIIVLTRYDMVSANGASSEPRCYKKSDGSQDARRWSPNIWNEPYNNSFQEIGTCFRQKLTIWPGKFVLSKKIPQSGLFLCARIWVTWLWKALDAEPVTPGQLQWYPWNLTGMTAQMGFL